MKLILLLATVVAAAYGSQQTFNGHQVWRITPTTDYQINVLKDLQENNQAYVFWSDRISANHPVDVMIPPYKFTELFTMLNSTSMDHQLFMHDVQYYVDRERPKTRENRAFDWTDYGTLDEVHTWLESIAAQYPDTVQLIDAGESYEGRRVLGVKVSFSPDNAQRGVFLEGGIHAREWISSAVVTYTLNELLTSQDPAVRALAESHDWYVFPNTNPDGYVYTFTNNRMWRKTRTPYSLGCYGADPNRNWDWSWNTAGTSNNPCSDVYAGPRAFSEKSMKVLSDYISTIAENLVAYIGHHSYSQLLLIPFGVAGDYPTNFDELLSNGKTAMKALQSVYGTQYTTGNIVDLLYPAAGGSMDWVKGVYNTRITYTYELRDTGRYGFLLPAEYIIPSGIENMVALVSLFEQFAA